MSASIDRVYLLWERGARGPTLSKLSQRGAPPALTEREKREKLCDPIALTSANAEMSLNTLAVLFPAPKEAGQ